MRRLILLEGFVVQRRDAPQSDQDASVVPRYVFGRHHGPHFPVLPYRPRAESHVDPEVLVSVELQWQPTLLSTRAGRARTIEDVVREQFSGFATKARLDPEDLKTALQESSRILTDAYNDVTSKTPRVERLSASLPRLTKYFALLNLGSSYYRDLKQAVIAFSNSPEG
jgi:hypothetical protein